MYTSQLLKVNDRPKALRFLLLSAVLWSLGGLFIKYITWSPLAIAGTRGLLAALTTAVLVPEARQWPKNKFVWLAALCYAGLCGTIVVSTKLTTSANAIFLQYTAPIHVIIISALVLKEKIKRLDVLVIVSTFLGMALFFAGEFSWQNLVGNLFGVASGIFFAVMVISFRYTDGAEPCSAILAGNLILFFLLAPFISQPFPSWQGCLSLVFLGTVQIGLAYVMYSRAIVHVAPLEGVIIAAVEPILNPLWVFFFIGERPSDLAILGGLIVMSTVTFYCWKKHS